VTLYWNTGCHCFIYNVRYINIQTGLCCCAVFEQYQKARVQFVQTIAEMASRPQNIELLQNAGVMSLLRPLLLDTVPSIQQTAALALGRLANYNNNLAEAVVKGDILPQLVYSLSEQNVNIFSSSYCSYEHLYSPMAEMTIQYNTMQYNKRIQKATIRLKTLKSKTIMSLQL